MYTVSEYVSIYIYLGLLDHDHPSEYKKEETHRIDCQQGPILFQPCSIEEVHGR
jgi:hypothetical protein